MSGVLLAFVGASFGFAVHFQASELLHSFAEAGGPRSGRYDLAVDYGSLHTGAGLRDVL